MRSSLHCFVANVRDLLALQVPRDYPTRAKSFPSHFVFHSPLHSGGPLSWAPGTPVILYTVTTFRFFKFLYPATDELAVESGLAANIGNCQAFFVPCDHSPSVSRCSARHAFLQKKLEKVEKLTNRKKIHFNLNICREK